MRSAMLCLMSGSIIAAAPAADAPTGPAPGTAVAMHAAAAPVTATWQEQHLTFSYFGRTVRYSCEGLREKVRAMLLDLGARRDIRLTASGCADAGRADSGRFPAHSVGPSLSIVFSALLPAAADGQSVDAPAVGARFETFVVTSDAFRNMEMGDCELVEEFARQVLPTLATRHVKQDIRCVPYQESGNRFLIQGEVLKAFTPPAQQRAP